jgi:multidrug efflux pump subunit AcrB
MVATVYPGASPSEIENTVTKSWGCDFFLGKH